MKIKNFFKDFFSCFSLFDLFCILFACILGGYAIYCLIDYCIFIFC
jgi:hypothetical protein